MSMSDPIADMLTRIRNGQKARLPEVGMPSSNLKAALAAVLGEAGYVGASNVEGDVKKTLTIALKFLDDKARTPVIEGIKRVSKPSCRVYVGSTQIPRVLGGLGTCVLSTSSGVMTGRKARQQNIGGEVLCYVW